MVGSKRKPIWLCKVNNIWPWCWKLGRNWICSCGGCNRCFKQSQCWFGQRSSHVSNDKLNMSCLILYWSILLTIPRSMSKSKFNNWVLSKYYFTTNRLPHISRGVSTKLDKSIFHKLKLGGSGIFFLNVFEGA